LIRIIEIEKEALINENAYIKSEMYIINMKLLKSNNKKLIPILFNLYQSLSIIHAEEVLLS
jgi:hypothetical protein